MPTFEKLRRETAAMRGEKLTSAQILEAREADRINDERIEIDCPPRATAEEALADARGMADMLGPGAEVYASEWIGKTLAARWPRSFELY